MRCDCCGEEKETTKLVLDPYQHDVNEAEVERLICDECYEQLVADI